MEQTPVAARLLCYEQPEEKSHIFGDLMRFIFTGPFHTAKVMDKQVNEMKETATFLVVFENGQRASETVEVGTPRYFKLMDLTERWESLQC